MRTMLRAVAVQDKEVRRHAILDAAEKLFLKHPDRMASVAEVAAAAHLAKGTVYLYFPSKEEMLLALHERQLSMFFVELVALLRARERTTFAEVFEPARRLIIRRPGYLALTSRCLGLMDREIPLERTLEYKIRVGQMLSQAGGELERLFPDLQAGEGIALLCNSYGLMIGLWQLLHPNERLGAQMRRPELAMLNRDYETEVEHAILALWAGVMANAAERARAAPKRRSR